MVMQREDLQRLSLTATYKAENKGQRHTNAQRQREASLQILNSK